VHRALSDSDFAFTTETRAWLSAQYRINVEVDNTALPLNGATNPTVSYGFHTSSSLAPLPQRNVVRTFPNDSAARPLLRIEGSDAVTCTRSRSSDPR
jgi:hypothetical protein